MDGYRRNDDYFLSLVGSFPACRKPRNSGHIAACRISTMGQFDAKCLALNFTLGTIHNG